MLESIIIFNLALCVIIELLHIIIQRLDKDNRLTYEVKYTFKVVLITLLIMSALNVTFSTIVAVSLNKEPTAQDVIDGKCVLEYTVVDGVRVDSCYVWKEKIDEK